MSVTAKLRNFREPQNNYCLATHATQPLKKKLWFVIPPRVAIAKSSSKLDASGSSVHDRVSLVAVEYFCPCRQFAIF